MSFKVYDGVKIDGVETLDDTFKFIQTARSTVLDAVESNMAKAIKNLACLIYDKHYVDGVNMLADDVDNYHSPLLSATMKNMHYQQSLEGDEARYSLGIGSYDGVTVALPFFGDRNTYEAFLELPNVSEFGYWNNTDPLETVSDKDWEKRKNIWNNVLHTTGIPSRTMLIVVLVDSSNLIPSDRHMVDLPSMDERLERLARDKSYIVFESQMRESGKKIEDLGWYTIHKRSMELSIGIKDELKGKLNESLTIKDLEKPLTAGE